MGYELVDFVNQSIAEIETKSHHSDLKKPYINGRIHELNRMKKYLVSRGYREPQYSCSSLMRPPFYKEPEPEVIYHANFV